MPSHSKPVNSNYFLSVENMLEEGLSEHDHITLNTTVHCVTKQQIDNRKFIHEPTTIVLHKLSCKPWKKSTQPTANKRSSTENNNFCFETPINSKISDSWLINLTRSPRKKDSRGHPPPTLSEIASVWTSPPLPSEYPLPSAEGLGGDGYFLGLHILSIKTTSFPGFSPTRPYRG